MSSSVPAVRDYRLLQISINFHGELDAEAIRKTFDKAIDWIHYMPNCWFVLTTSDAERWYARLMPLLGDTDTMLICEVEPGRISGWIQRWIIDWLNKSTERVSRSRPSSS